METRGVRCVPVDRAVAADANPPLSWSLVQSFRSERRWCRAVRVSCGKATIPECRASTTRAEELMFFFSLPNRVAPTSVQRYGYASLGQCNHARMPQAVTSGERGLCES